VNVTRLQESVYLLFGIIEVLIGIRFVLRAFGASPEAPFPAAIYAVTGPLLAPLALWLGPPQLSQSSVEPHCAVGIIVYALLGWVVAKLVGLIADTRQQQTIEPVPLHSEDEHDFEHHLAA
jgi:YggT family protein